MTGSRVRGPIFVGLLLALLAVALQGVQGEEALDQVPSESQCRPYIEKALKDLGTGSLEESSAEVGNDAEDSADEGSTSLNEQGNEPSTYGSKEEGDVELDEHSGRDSSSNDGLDHIDGGSNNSDEENETSTEGSTKTGDENPETDDDNIETVEVTSGESRKDESGEAASDEDSEGDDRRNETKEEETSEGSAEVAKSDEATVPMSVEDTTEDNASNDEETEVEEKEAESTERVDDGSIEVKNEEESDEVEAGIDDIDEDQADEAKSHEDKSDDDDDSKADREEADSETGDNNDDENGDSNNNDIEDGSNNDGDDNDNENDDDNEDTSKGTRDSDSDKGDSEEEETASAEGKSGEASEEKKDGVDKPDSNEDDRNQDDDDNNVDGDDNSRENEIETDREAQNRDQEDNEVIIKESTENVEGTPVIESAEDDANKGEEEASNLRNIREERGVEEGVERSDSGEDEDTREDSEESKKEGESEEDEEEAEPTPEEDLIQERDVPENLRPRDHINQLLKLDEENEEKERAIQRAADIVLRDLKRLYDNAIKPLETLYKYRDLSNRHFGDSEIFSKPLVLFMGPWSGGKSSIINYLLDNEYKQTSLRTDNGINAGAEPSPAYFNILMHGEEEEVLDGTQLAADWTFSGLQKFGQGMLDRLRGLRLKNELLEKVNIVEIPGILEIRKQVQRLFPFNDACQWFIDRADIIFLVYDPAKLDVGPETEAILDQLKGREYQTRIILNKADQVKPEELMRVQGALIWNISPLMSSAEPPIMYSTSLWSLPYEAGAPTRLLYAQERAFLRDLRSAIDKRVEHKIASARRFAVRVRNHAKMVDCYLTTYYNHKTFFGNKKETSDKIIENPQDYHIYEGLSTLTNISRYDLPDPDVYRDFFRLNSLYDFQQLSATCTYFRGCPINRLDVAIAYDLPELVGKYKKSVEAALHQEKTATTPPAS